MGACNFIQFKAAGTAQHAFDALVAEAEWDHGHDPYNGTISTTYLKRGHATVAEEWGEAARDAAIGMADADGWGEKRESRAIDCGRTGEAGLHMWAFYGWAAC